MAPLPPIRDRTLLLCDRRLEEVEATTPERPYLGMSSIGTSCARRLWYRFRWVRRTPFRADQLKKFRDGHMAEAMVVRQLQQCEWLDVIAHDEHGEQREYRDFAGHFLGHQDGEITGIIEAPKTPHCLEVKATEKMDELKQCIIEHGEKDALRHWWPEYYGQAQCYMGYGDYTRHYLVVCSPGARDWISVRTDFNATVFNSLRERADYIIFTERPPERLCPKDTHFEAHWCEHAPVCFGNPTIAGRHCRTCMHATPERDGGWSCQMQPVDGKPGILSLPEQRAGCPLHRFHPHLLHDRKVVAGSALAMRYELNSGGEWVDEGPTAEQAG
jgi:hypothetical protein